MKYTGIVLLIILTSCADKKVEISATKVAVTPNVPAIAFHRDSAIYLQRENQKPLFVVKGFSPAISPDGKQLTFQKYSLNNASEIFIMDLASKKCERLNVRSNNFHDAVWSPDGIHIAFNVFVDSDWKIGIIKSNNADFRILNDPSEWGIQKITWATDGKSIIAHSFFSLLEISLDGQPLQQMNIRDKISDKFNLSGNDRFWATTNKKGFYFTCGVREKSKGKERSVKAVMYYNRKTDKVTRLSPTDCYVDDLFVADDSTIFFSASPFEGDTAHIYRYDREHDKLDLFVRGADTPTWTTKL
ncbi:TolB family protein [Pseudochryseolinea flava]|uniref:Dipeptidylpeptidase IV N-terminal domain-containing protein n=1 Tax=Pseudochryseolinea flava TaxID=2059302 RepID=A0A364XXC9_9BACT|nr:PD40 domain-containing protein [Pseudochryseolinea flava]RAV98941.1 hypothetical protein DQQ10_21830 [Pseudochryseolinea flava]